MFNRSLQKRFGFVVCAAAAVGLLAGQAFCAEDRLPLLQVGSEVYSNVTVTGITATDIYFDHAQGMGNAKLKNLDPDLQKRFGYDATQAGRAETIQQQANTLFRIELATRIEAQAKARAEEVSSDAISYDDGDLVVNTLYARSFRGRHPPLIIAEDWLPQRPDVEGKFILVEFWSPRSEPCLRVIPHLNRLQARFSNRLVVLGLTDEPPDAVLEMTSPHVDYYTGTDAQARTRKLMGVEAIPHAVLIDPKRIVRFEGVPGYLTEKALARLIERYSE